MKEVGMAEKNLCIAPELYSKLEARAKVEGKTPDELGEEAVRALLIKKDLRAFVAQNRRDAEANGLTEADVVPLSEEYRNETRRGR
jgi:hypothetical protein